MAEPQLSVRSAKARDLAHCLARRERRSVADIVERALEPYEVSEAGREPAAFGIRKIDPDQRAERLGRGLADWRHRFADRIFSFTEAAALAYGDIMSSALRSGRAMMAPDGMIAAIARINGARLATRNLANFATTGLEIVSPWEF